MLFVVHVLGLASLPSPAGKVNVIDCVMYDMLTQCKAISHIFKDTLFVTL